MKPKSPIVSGQGLPAARDKGRRNRFPLEKPHLPAPARGLPNLHASVMAQGILDGKPTIWLLPEEVPVSIHIDSAAYAVMMATPADLEDFAIGFVLSEGLVAHASHIRNVLVIPSGEGWTADIAVAEGKLLRERMALRSLEGRAGCGLCGITEMEQVIRMPQTHAGAARPRLDPAAVARAFDSLPSFQPMNAVNRTVHAAAWCQADGSILLAREDVGRHNALDKLIGALLRGGTDPSSGFAAVTSRASYEMVHKAAAAGIPLLSAVSAPTALAVRTARDAGLTLIGFARQDRHTVYASPHSNF